MVDFLSDFEAVYQSVPLTSVSTSYGRQRSNQGLSNYLHIVADDILSTHIDTKTSYIFPINTRIRKCYNDNIHFINLINSLETLGHGYRVQK
jgi:hypothetical protein